MGEDAVEQRQPPLLVAVPLPFVAPPELLPVLKPVPLLALLPPPQAATETTIAVTYVSKAQK